MLQKLDTAHVNRHRLADALAGMSPSEFDMRSTSHCICGHALRLFGRHKHFVLGWRSQVDAGATLLGITTVQAQQLFAPPDRCGTSVGYTSPKDAARVVRYLAATDTVDWSVAGKPSSAGSTHTTTSPARELCYS
jgi:hypothetical protein